MYYLLKLYYLMSDGNSSRKLYPLTSCADLSGADCSRYGFPDTTCGCEITLSDIIQRDLIIKTGSDLVINNRLPWKQSYVEPDLTSAQAARLFGEEYSPWQQSYVTPDLSLKESAVLYGEVPGDPLPVPKAPEPLAPEPPVPSAPAPSAPPAPARPVCPL